MVRVSDSWLATAVAFALAGAPAWALADAPPPSDPDAPAKTIPAPPDPDEIELDDSYKATAQQLFEDGMHAMQAGELETACAAFAESQRLDPAIGTRFNLADCYEQLGRLASAWVHYVGVADEAERRAQMERAQFARTRAEALEPRLSRIRVSVTDPVPGLEIRREDITLGRPQWSVAVPVDRGQYRIVATAPEHDPWEGTVDVTDEGSTVDVEVPPLVASAPPPVETPTVVPAVRPPEPSITAAGPKVDEVPRARRLGPRHIAGIVVGSAGLAVMGVGTAFGIVATQRKDEADARCPRPDACFSDGAQRLQDAERAGRVSTGMFVAGGVLLATGVVLVATGHLGRRRESRRAALVPGRLTVRF